MKDREYINIMNRISEKHIEEAVTWEDPAQQNRKSIRRMSLGIGSIAASITVVAGCIGYDALHRAASPFGDESSISEGVGGNLLGGSGEIRGYTGTGNQVLFCDDVCWYLPDENIKWDRNGAGAASFPFADNLLTDGEQLYTCHDNQLFISDGFGGETLFADVPWQVNRIQKLSDDWYLLSALVEYSWIDDQPQPYAILNRQSGSTQFCEYGNVRLDGDTLFYADFENTLYSAPVDNVQAAQPVYTFPAELSALTEWTIRNGTVMSVHTDQNGDIGCYVTDVWPAAEVPPEPQAFFNGDSYWEAWHFLGGRLYTMSADFSGGNLVLTDTPLGDGGQDEAVFSVETASLWDDDQAGGLLDTAIFDTGDYIIFTLPLTGRNGEQIVEYRRDTGEYRYAGIGYAPEHPALPEDTELALPQPDSGYCSPEVFPMYYIPAEHLDSDGIVCCRMLPAVPASASQFDADALYPTLPQGGGFMPDPNDHPHLSLAQAKEILLQNENPDDSDGVFRAFSQAAGDYAGKFPLGLNCAAYEYWLADDGSELILVICSYTPSTEEYDYVYFRYDADAKQYAYEFLTPRSQSAQPEQGSVTAGGQVSEVNVLGGRGSIRVFRSPRGDRFAEDDVYFYDLKYKKRYQNGVQDPEFLLPLTEGDPDVQHYDEMLAAGDRILLSDDHALYQIRQDGTLETLYSFPVGGEQDPYTDVTLMRAAEFGRPQKLFVTLGFQDAGYSIDYQDAVLDLQSHDLLFLHTRDSEGRRMYLITEDAVCAIAEHGSAYELIQFADDDSFTVISPENWNINGNERCCIDENRQLWFVNTDGQFCCGSMDDGSVRVVDEAAYQLAAEAFSGTGKSVRINPSEAPYAALCNNDGSEAVTLKESADSEGQECIPAGAYCENGITHIILQEYAKDGSQPAKTTVYTVDGGKVSAESYDCPV